MGSHIARFPLDSCGSNHRRLPLRGAARMTVASGIARRQMAGDAAGGLLNPKAPSLVRNHAKENIRAMREKERLLRGKQIMQCQAQAAPVELFKLKQFAGAKSRLHDPKKELRKDLGTPGAQAAADRAEEKDEISLEEFEAKVDEMIQKHGKRPSQNFSKDEKGCPAYLRKMKQEREEKQREEMESRSKPQVPAGYRVMPASEVQETLGALKKKHLDLEAEYRRLPLKLETEGQKQRQKAVLDKIQQSEKAMELFSRPVVMVEA
eukprot:TRINITY_DN77954_c0_g1_i1.p1 TRINITY_DN77954_c0_g1~~TRINITY_DN77954_c0_g1_i1.p1  ORF type:complete len:288 (-),score=70.62 TRINITY_DN77954_c0_g1_i1:94-885(-)